MSSNSPVQHFLSNDNVQMLWEVIIDDPSVSQNKTTQQVFTRIIPEFFEREKTKFKSLMEMNKHFITVLIDLLKNAPEPKQPNKEKITFEELHQERVSQFEQALSARQEEFSQAMALPLPPVPNFADEQLDKPLTEMEKIIQQTIAERNLEMEKIQQALSANKQNTQSDTWLQPQATSIKEVNEREKQAALTSVYAPKTIKIGKELKEVSWGENTEIEYANIVTAVTPPPITDSIFSKLKVKDPLKDLEERINARIDAFEQRILSILEKK